MVQQNQKGFTEIDMKVFQVINNIGNSSNLGVLQSNDAQKVRERSDVTSSECKIILIGKDGTEKMRTEEALSKWILFKIIDSIPMRRLKMK